MSHAKGLFCEHCQREIPKKEFKTRCESCGGPLILRYDLAAIHQSLSNRPMQLRAESLLRQWLDILPIDRSELIDKVSLGEQATPLVFSGRLGKELGIDELRFKLEFLGPTLSLKDRGTSLCPLKAMELGYDTLCIASSGNNAASVAAYAAKAGLKAVVIIQKSVSPAKILKIVSYGASVVRIDGDMSAASQVCNEMADRHRWFHSGGTNPYRYTAKRTVAYEIFYQLGGKAPDAIVYPVGGATGIASAYTGFWELHQMKWIPSMPMMIGVQIAACDPVTQAFDAQREEIRPVVKKSSISDALLNNSPFWGKQALQAVRETGGRLVSVSDEEFIRSIRIMAVQEGIFLEPAGAVPVAGLLKLRQQKKLPSLKTVVCMVTGHGLNAPDAAVRPDEVPQVIPAETSAVEAYLGL